MKRKTKVLIFLLILIISVLTLSSCFRQSERVSHNIKLDADNFKIRRRITVLNTRTDKTMMQVTGLLSIDVDSDNDLNIVIEKAPNEFILNYAHLSDDTTYTVEQIETSDVNRYAYNIAFYPEVLVSGWYDIQFLHDDPNSKTFESTDGVDTAGSELSPR